MRLPCAPVKVPQIILGSSGPMGRHRCLASRQNSTAGACRSAATRGAGTRLCIRLGCCLKADARNLLIASPTTNVVAFTRAVLAAKGLDPDLVRRPAYREVSEFVHTASSGTRSRNQLSGNDSRLSHRPEARALLFLHENSVVRADRLWHVGGARRRHRTDVV